jgi:signal transduction histidine kinase
MKLYNRYWIKGWVKIILPLYLFTFLPLLAVAQGLPLIRNYTAEEYGGHNRNFDIEIDKDGTVYVANFEGLLYYDRAQWRIVRAPELNRVTTIYHDTENTIFVGGYNFTARLQKRANGVLCLQKVSDESAEENEVLDGIIQTEKLDGGLQVQVRKNNGLAITDNHGRELFTITESNGLCSNQVARIVYDGHGVIWGATAHGIFAIELPSVYSYFLPKDGLTGEVQAIAAYAGRMYIGYTDGVMAVASHQCRRISGIDNICWALGECRDGLLAATSSGIFKIAPDNHISRLTSSSTTALLVNGDKVYAGEPDGVYVYQSNFRQRTKVNDLPLVVEIQNDGQGGLWLKNVHGKTTGTVPNQTHKLLADLANHVLMPLSNINITAQYHHGDQVWIGGDGILAIADTSKKDLAQLTNCHTIRFRSIVMGNDSILWGGYSEMPEEPFKLGSDERHLRFSYALDYAPLTGKTLYRHRLNNDKWSGWSKKQSLEFLNHPYGSYTLCVQALLPNGELSEVATVNYSIAFPLLMRWYMVILYFFAFAYLGNILLRYRLKRLEKDKMKLEHIVEERTADLRNAQHELIRQEKMASVGKLTEGLIDRILNPMNYIINFSKMSIDLLKDLKTNIENNKDVINEDDYLDSEDVLGMLTENLQNVDQYGQNTTRTLKAMEEMLKDRTGGYMDMDLLPILQQNEQMLNNYHAQEKEQYHIKTVFTLPTEEMSIYGNPEMLSKVIMSLLGNAVYAVIKKAQRLSYSPEVSLIATIDDGHYTLKIRDNGVGIEEAIIDKIFDPFFTTKTTDEAAGIGLYLTHEIIQNHKGDINVVSVKDEFTEFTITLPILSEQ